MDKETYKEAMKILYLLNEAVDKAIKQINDLD